MLKHTMIAKTFDELEFMVSRCFSSKISPLCVTVTPFVVRCDEIEVTLYKIVEEVPCEDVF